MKFYDKKKLLNAAKDRGYVTERAVALALAPIFNITPRVMESKISQGRFSKEECEVIGSFFEMTMKEYYDIFMSGLFIEDREGHYVCHVDDLKQHIKPPTAKVSPQRNRQVRIERILEDLEEI